MAEGFIRLSRKILNWEWMDDSITFHVFVYLLLNANYEERKYHGYDIKRGEVVVGLENIAKNLHLSVRNVRTALKHLKSTNEVTIRTTNKFSIVTICNFDSWQGLTLESDKQSDEQSDKQPTNNRQITDKQVTTPKEINKEINKETNNNIPPIIPQGDSDIVKGLMDKIASLEEQITEMQKKKRSTFTPPTLEELDAYIREQNFSFTAQQFIDHYESNGWMVGKNKMKDWKAACRTWNSSRYKKQKQDLYSPDFGIADMNDPNRYQSTIDRWNRK